MAFTKAALMLEDAKKKINDIEEYSKALRFNHLLWTIIQADLTEPDNNLPDEIRAWDGWSDDNQVEIERGFSVAGLPGRVRVLSGRCARPGVCGIGRVRWRRWCSWRWRCACCGPMRPGRRCSWPRHSSR